MAQPLVFDDLWTIVAHRRPAGPPKSNGGRPRVPDRACLTGIIFVLKSGIPWELLPLEMSCGAGIWDRLLQTLLDRLGEADHIDWERAWYLGFRTRVWVVP